VAARPCPLEIVAAQPAGDIHDLTDEVETWDLPTLERLGGEFGGVHPAERHLGLGIAFIAGGLDLPRLQCSGHGLQIPLGDLRQGA